MADASSPPAVLCSTGPFWALDLEAAFDAVAEAGFTSLELMVTRDPATQEPTTPARLAAERGLHISALHGPFLALTRGVWGADPVAKIRRGAEMCRALGAGMLIVHPPYLWERSYARWLVHEASSFMTEARVAVAVETMYPLWLAGRKLGAYQWLEPGELARAAPCIAMDTSHVTVGRLDVLSTYAVLADKVVHIHLSNNAGDGRDGHLELDSGVVPVNRFLDELAGTGYTGSLALELSVRRYLERPRELVEALRRNRQYVEDRLARATRQPKELGRQ